jgi:hypothetical protein
LTTNLKNYNRNLNHFPTPQNGLTVTSEVLTFHVRSLSKTRLKQHIGTLFKSEIAKIQKYLNEAPKKNLLTEQVKPMTDEEYEALLATGWTLEGTDETPSPA